MQRQHPESALDTRDYGIWDFCLFCNSGCMSTYYSISSKRLGPAENVHTALAQDETPQVPVSAMSRHDGLPAVLRLLQSPWPSWLVRVEVLTGQAWFLSCHSCSWARAFIQQLPSAYEFTTRTFETFIGMWVSFLPFQCQRKLTPLRKLRIISNGTPMEEGIANFTYRDTSKPNQERNATQTL